MDEAVLQSAGPRLETQQSPPWWQQTEKAVCRVGGITCNAEGFAGETGAVDVLEGGERDTNDLLSCSHYPLKGLAAGRVAGAIPHSDAASQDALDGASVEGAHDGGRGSGSSEFAEEVETLLCFLGQCCSVVGPGEVLCDVHTQELGAAHSLHGRTVDGQRSMLSVHSPEVNNNLLRLLHIQREIVVPAPPGQAAHLAPVVCLISVANETHHSRVIRKLNEKVRVVWRCAVVGQQSEEEGAQHTSLGGPCVQCDGAGCVNISSERMSTYAFTESPTVGWPLKCLWWVAGLVEQCCSIRGEERSAAAVSLHPNAGCVYRGSTHCDTEHGGSVNDFRVEPQGSSSMPGLHVAAWT